MNEFYQAWERYYDDAIMAQSRKYTQAWKKAFADEAVRNCNTNPRTGRMRGVPRIDIQSAAGNQKQ